MEIYNNVTTNNSPKLPPVDWVAVQNLYAQAAALFRDMNTNPQNMLEDLNKLIDISQQMDKLTVGHKPPASCPDPATFYGIFTGFTTYLEQLKSTFVSGITNNKDFAQYLKNAGIELDNIEWLIYK